MKKLSITLFAALLVLGMTIPALAEVNVFATVYKEKDIFVTVDVDIFKDVKFDVTVDVDLFQGAEADSIANQAHFENIVVGLRDEEVADKNFRSAVITNSIN